MGTFAGQLMVTAAFRRLVTLCHLDNPAHPVRDAEDLSYRFNGLAWDEKAFSLTDEGGIQWAIAVSKHGPALVIAPTRPDMAGETRISGQAFWRHLLGAVGSVHPAPAPAQENRERQEGLFSRLFHSNAGGTGAPAEKWFTSGETDAVRDHRLKMRAMQQRRAEETRRARAAEARAMYEIWYQ
ncbi:MAG: hypothetical protein WCF85_07900 [Rhodospirillaceae bacterium]